LAAPLPTFTPIPMQPFSPGPMFPSVGMAPPTQTGGFGFPPVGAPMRRDQILRIVDDFVAPPFPGAAPPHGQQVEEAVRATGYQGPVEHAQYPRENMTSDVARASLEALGRPGMNAEDARAALTRHMVNSQNSTLNGAAQALNQDVRAGVTNSVTNLSYGTGPAGSAQVVYRLARQGWEPAPTPVPGADPVFQAMAESNHERSRNLMTNLATAWGIDPAALSSTDPAVNGPARQRFQQNLVDQAQAASQDPSVQGAVQNYRRAEQAYTDKNNNVVVSAGNWGDLMRQMGQDNGNREVKVGENFQANLLVGPNSISVGSLDLNPQTGAPRVADYSNADSRVDLYAYGELGSINGTSYAAPRVAAVAQAVRLENPNASPSDVRQRVMQIFTTRGPGATGTTTNQEQSGNVANYLGQVQWPRQTFTIPGMN